MEDNVLEFLKKIHEQPPANLGGASSLFWYNGGTYERPPRPSIMTVLKGEKNPPNEYKKGEVE